MSIVITRTLADTIVVFKSIEPTAENGFISGEDLAEFPNNTPASRRAAALVAVHYSDTLFLSIEVEKAASTEGSSAESFYNSMMEHLGQAATALQTELI